MGGEEIAPRSHFSLGKPISASAAATPSASPGRAASGTGAALEIPRVQCFFEKDQLKAVATLSKGQSLTVRGKVSGLMMNVLVKKCAIAK